MLQEKLKLVNVFGSGTFKKWTKRKTIKFGKIPNVFKCDNKFPFECLFLLPALVLAETEMAHHQKPLQSVSLI
jgi:hypothetical protein